VWVEEEARVVAALSVPIRRSLLSRHNSIRSARC
jgi:hypothetical protein